MSNVTHAPPAGDPAPNADVEGHFAHHPDAQKWRRFVRGNRASLGTLGVLVAMMLVFVSANPTTFSDWTIYRSVMTTLPVAIFMVVPLVFIVTVGEIDLSFPAVMGFSAWIFALLVQAGFDPLLGMIAGVATGMALGFGVGAIVVYLNLSSLVATLGLNFALRGVIQILMEGKSIPLVTLNKSWAYKIFSSQLFGVPVQMLWALLFVGFAAFLYNRHRFGAQVHAVGDNPDSAKQMGININAVRVKTFVFMGFGAALAGVFSTMVNFTWWPTSGEGYMLPVLASVFVGGTPTWGGIGTVVGGAIGATIVAVIQTGVVAAGLTGFWVQFCNGLVIILSLIGHRWNQIRYR